MNGLSKDPNSGLYEYTSKVRNGLNINNNSLSLMDIITIIIDTTI